MIKISDNKLQQTLSVFLSLILILTNAHQGTLHAKNIGSTFKESPSLQSNHLSPVSSVKVDKEKYLGSGSKYFELASMLYILTFLIPELVGLLSNPFVQLTYMVSLPVLYILMLRKDKFSNQIEIVISFLMLKPLILFMFILVNASGIVVYNYIILVVYAGLIFKYRKYQRKSFMIFSLVVLMIFASMTQATYHKNSIDKKYIEELSNKKGLTQSLKTQFHHKPWGNVRYNPDKGIVEYLHNLEFKSIQLEPFKELEYIFYQKDDEYYYNEVLLVLHTDGQFSVIKIENNKIIKVDPQLIAKNPIEDIYSYDYVIFYPVDNNKIGYELGYTNLTPFAPKGFIERFNESA